MPDMCQGGSEYEQKDKAISESALVDLHAGDGDAAHQPCGGRRCAGEGADPGVHRGAHGRTGDAGGELRLRRGRAGSAGVADRRVQRRDAGQAVRQLGLHLRRSGRNGLRRRMRELRRCALHL